MKLTTLVLTMFWISTSFAAFEDYFENKTLRIDYYHTGDANSEIFSLDQVYEQGEWPGTRQHLVNDLNLGLYEAQVYDLETGTLIFNYGFNSIFGEWKTTQEALDGIHRTMHETIRCPMPKKDIRFTIAKRDRENVFQSLWSVEISPSSRFVNRERKQFPYRVKKVMDSGPASDNVDILIMGDGYRKKDRKKFHQDIKRYTNSLFDSAPFDSLKAKFNVWTINVISPDSGIDEPRKNVWKHNKLGATFNSFDTERYVLTFDNRTLHDIASLVPYDVIYIIFNTPRYGGGGIYNTFATCYTGTPVNQPDWWSDYVFVHEFGHSFAGLADEYYSSQVAYNEMYPLDIEPWESNITTVSANSQAKWHEKIGPDVPVPTPWQKARYDSLAIALRHLDKTMANYEQKQEKIKDEIYQIINKDEYSGRIGCFQGGGYASEGIYRPAIDCRMFSKSLTPFCPVCRETIKRVIQYYVD